MAPCMIVPKPQWAMSVVILICLHVLVFLLGDNKVINSYKNRLEQSAQTAANMTANATWRSGHASISIGKHLRTFGRFNVPGCVVLKI